MAASYFVVRRFLITPNLQHKMLAVLSIKNYAIIDELTIDFSGGLNVITGETGAGKSIIVGALGLILGERADSAVLVNKEKKCVVEGVFKTDQKKVRRFLKEQELDVEEELVIRREIASNGKSRAFINDSPVNLSQLQQLSSLLVDMHRQFDTLEIGESDFQRQVLDALAGNQARFDAYEQCYTGWLETRRVLHILLTQKQQFEKEADYNRFQFTELEEAAFKENELEDIALELKTLSNAEGIKAALNRVYDALENAEQPLVQQLKSMAQQLNPYLSYHAQLPALAQRLQAAQVELQDIADELDRVSSHIQYDPERIEQLNERLSEGYRLQKKHGVSSTAELLQIQTALEQKLQAVLQIDDQITVAQQQAHTQEQEAGRLAAQLSDARHKQAKPLEEKVNKLLAQVGMPNARIQVSLQAAALQADGADAIEFLFDANKSGQFQPIRKVASGGELSRLMLCIKSLVARKMDLPTLIFDEIDTGISGEAARQVGLILKELSGNRQVICITHQPQIAGKGDAHFYVYKEVENDKVKTNIRQLSTDERIISIARMLSGERPTAAALENARELVGG